jgi:uncharacterized repeat protein (TIGR01451 family)
VVGAVVSGGARAAPGDTDLALTKSDSPDPVTAGDNLIYTIKVDNPGTLPATQVTVTDDLPGGSSSSPRQPAPVNAMRTR